MNVIPFPVSLEEQVKRGVESARLKSTMKDGSVDAEGLACEIIRLVKRLRPVFGQQTVLVALRPHMDTMTDAEFVAYGRYIRARARPKVGTAR